MDGVEYGADRLDRAEFGAGGGGDDPDGRLVWLGPGFEADGDGLLGGGGCLDDEEGRAEVDAVDEDGPLAGGGFRDLL